MGDGHGVPNQGPSMNGAVWTLTTLSFILLALRLYCKFLQHRGFWWDDHILTVSWLLLLATSSMVSANVAIGFGMHSEDVLAKYGPQNLSLIGLRGTVIGVFMVLAAVWSKTSFAVTLLRFTFGWQKSVVWAIIVTMNIFMILSAVLNFAQCNPVQKVWDPYVEGKCWPGSILIGFSIFAGAYGALMDITLAFLPWTILLGLNMRKREKVGVVLAMSMGVFAGATAIAKCVYLQVLASGDFFYDGAGLVIWGTAEAATTIMAASVPVLRVLVSEIRSSNGPYYDRSGTNGGDTTRRTRHVRGDLNTTTVTAHGRAHELNSKDDDSDKSILYGTGLGRITKTAEVQIQFESRSDEDHEAYEMERVIPSRARMASPV
ncbi:hypothetical protein F5Y15DRAFT_415364 [Xylariaceae sp. FL0016]|nr:hypothetical protein F5Y15DRAFT_415364 [Xylariaceae sp. FL0016]